MGLWPFSKEENRIGQGDIKKGIKYTLQTEKYQENRAMKRLSWVILGGWVKWQSDTGTHRMPLVVYTHYPANTSF